ncbi:MAG: glycosyltransferase family 4 protein [Bacteroidales bacterium]|nr:glycosyltransferase family 4 protein [Bacteroidales bacterium]MBR6929723.1 glycosyltransferase family 4 protein [Bacteroidales bacterium]
MVLTEKKILRLFSGFKQKAELLFEKGRFDLSLKYWEAATRTAYCFYLDENDQQIEKGLQKFAANVKKEKIYPLLSNRCVFYDAHSRDKGALTQQYIRAIFASGWDMLYITEKSQDDVFFKPILAELKEHADKVTVHHVPANLRGMERIQHIVDCVMGWKCDKLFVHILPWSVTAVAAFNALPKTIERFYINHTDHTYCVGTSCMDFCFEFRQYGCNLSLKKRGVERKKLLLLPYYPIESHQPFHGFPFDRKGKIVIFSGGSFYKVFDEQDTFIEICKSLLAIDPRIVIAYAGFGSDRAFREAIEKKGISDRVFLLGVRKDISALYDNVDFYLNTYPIGGALMCLFAAMHGVPLLAYHNDKKTRMEEVVCQTRQMEISSMSIDELCGKAKELITDEKKRKAYSDALMSCCISSDQFNKAFLDAVNTKSTPFPIQIDDDFNYIPFDRIAKIELENKRKGYHREIVKCLGMRNALTRYPSFVFDSIVDYLKIRIVKKR